MGSSKTGKTGLNDDYLMELLMKGNYRTNLEKVKQELLKSLDDKNTYQLLQIWKVTKPGILRGFVEEKIAEKYQNYKGPYELLPTIAKKYFNRVGSIDAIVTLTYAKCEGINQRAMQKYINLMEEYLEYFDEFTNDNKVKDFKPEGFKNKIISFPNQSSKPATEEVKENGEVYKIKDFKSRRK